MVDGLGWPHPPLWAPWRYNWWLACSRGSTSVKENFPLTSQLFHLLPNVSPLLYSKTSWKELSILIVSTSFHPTFFSCPLKTISERLSPLLYNDTAFVRVTDDLHIAKYSGDLAVFLLIPLAHLLFLEYLLLSSETPFSLGSPTTLGSSSQAPLLVPTHPSHLYCQSASQQKPWASLSSLIPWVALYGPMTWNIHLYAGSPQTDTSSLKFSLEFQIPFSTSYSASSCGSLLGISTLTCPKPDNIHKKFFSSLSSPS